MAVTVTTSRIGVTIAEAQANAAMRANRTRTTKGLVLAEAQANAIANTATASE